MCVVACAAGDQLASQARIFVHFEHVNADVRHADAYDFAERLPPARHALVRQTSNEINVNIVDSSTAQSLDVLQDHRSRVLPAYGRGFLINEGLHTEADAVHADPGQRIQHRLGEGSGSAFDRDLRACLNFELLTQGSENFLEVSRIENCWRAAAEIDGIDVSLQHATRIGQHLFDPGDVVAEPLDIAIDAAAREYTGCEVAVAALHAAKRDRDVN